MGIRINSDWSEIDRELDRVANLPGRRTKRVLDSVLDKGFALTQAAVHVETGALKASGQHSSDLNRMTHTWEGEIVYGSSGFSGPVDYAIYEKARDVGGAGGPSDAKGDHDFIQPLAALDIDYRIAIKEALTP